MWADKQTIGHKLYAGVGVLLLLTVLEASVALWGSSSIATDVPMKRASSKSETPAAMARLAYVCRSAYGLRCSRPAARTAGVQ